MHSPRCLTLCYQVLVEACSYIVKFSSFTDLLRPSQTLPNSHENSKPPVVQLALCEQPSGPSFDSCISETPVAARSGHWLHFGIYLW